MTMQHGQVHFLGRLYPFLPLSFHEAKWHLRDIVMIYVFPNDKILHAWKDMTPIGCANKWQDKACRISDASLCCLG
jgi:hypothetical protein